MGSSSSYSMITPFGTFSRVRSFQTLTLRNDEYNTNYNDYSRSINKSDYGDVEDYTDESENDDDNLQPIHKVKPYQYCINVGFRLKYSGDFMYI